ncbi:uncharacterized protein C6orf118-like [Diretmus argenteus]
MSTSCKPRCCGMRSEIHRLLLAAEAGHKADVLTYSSGHLGPRSLTPLPHTKTKQSLWRTSQGREQTPNPQTLQQRQTEVRANLKKMKNRLFEFTPDSALVESNICRPGQEEATDSASQTDRKEETSPPKMVLNTSNSLLVKPRSPAQTKSPSWEEEGQQRFWISHSHQAGMTKKEQLREMQRFGRQLVGKRDLWELKSMAGRKAAEMHERKLQKELKKLSVQSWPSRERLAVFSDVFDDVCEGSPVFGGILREIKTEYDLYLDSIMASLSSLQDMSLNAPVEELNNVRAEELEEAEEEVSRLEEEAGRALKENERVRNEFQKAMRGPEDRDPPLPGQPQDNGADVFSTEMVQSKRLQVWDVWKEIQELEKEIKEKMVSKITTTDSERCIRDSKVEIMRLRASNDHLKVTNKDLVNNINKVLNQDKASKAFRQYVSCC